MSERQDKRTVRADAIGVLVESFASDTAQNTVIIGAGCSASANISLAGELVQQAIVEFPAACGKIDTSKPNAYGAVMTRLDHKQRRQLINGHIAKAKLTWGMIALAHLLKTGRVGRVLSLNFDNVLARCCGLIGLYPAIYDFGAAPVSNVKALSEPAIVHLHGQHSGFVQLNSTEEAQRHVKSLAALIADSVHDRAVLVIGYSGASDPILDALVSAYDPGARLYWVDKADVPNNAVMTFLQGKPLAHFVGGCEADLFLLDLARAVALKTGEKNWTPQIIHDPLGHLLTEVAPVGDFPRDEQNKDDLLALWKQRLTTAKVDYDAKFGGDNALVAAQAQADTDAIAGAVRDGGVTPSAEIDRAAYWAAIEAAELARRQGDLETAAALYETAAALDPTGWEALTNWGITLGDKAKRDGPDVDALFAAACAKFEAALAIKPDNYLAYYNWGITLGDMAKRDGPDADAVFAQACAKYEAALTIKPDYYVALYNWGNTLNAMALRDGPSSLALFAKACTKYEAALAVKPDDHEALYNWGTTLAAMMERGVPYADALFAQACAKFEAALAIKPDNHLAFYNWGITLGDMAKRDGPDADALFAKACVKFEAALAIKPDNHLAFYNWGITLDDMAKRGGPDADALFAQACAKYEAALAIKPDYYEALLNLGNTLGDMAMRCGPDADALFAQACDQFEAAFAIKPDKPEALNNWGSTLIDMAAQPVLAAEVRADLLEQATDKLQAADRIAPGIASYNLACLLARSNLPDACHSYLMASHRHERLPPRQHLETDSDLDSVRALPWFAHILALADDEKPDQ